MADEISDLRLLTQLVAAGSLTEASKRLNSSLPAVSRRLGAMEARLGVRLIDRHARRFQLTEEGALLHERARRILTEVDEAEAEASAGGRAPRGSVRMICPVHIGRVRMAGLVASFSRMYPGVQVELVLSDAQVDVTADEADVALSVGLPANPLVVARRFAGGRRVVCASPDYLARHGVPQVPEELADHDCLRLVRGSRRMDRWRFQRDGELFEVPVSGRLVTTSSEVMYQWTLDGYGIGIKGLWDIAHDLESGRLVECVRSFACDDVDLYLVYARRPHLPPRIRVFVDFLMAEAIRD